MAESTPKKAYAAPTRPMKIDKACASQPPALTNVLNTSLELVCGARYVNGIKIARKPTI